MLFILATYYAKRRKLEMIDLDLPKAGFLPEEVGKLAGMQPKTIYAAIKRGNVQTYTDSLGNYRISREEAYRFLYNRREKNLSK